MDSLGRQARLTWLLVLIGSVLSAPAAQYQTQRQQAQASAGPTSSASGSALSTPSKYCPNTKCIVVDNRLYLANGTMRALTASEKAEIKAAQAAQRQSLDQSIQQYQAAYSEWRTAFNANGGRTEQKPPVQLPQLATSVQMPVSVVELSPGAVLQWEGITITSAN
uniref:Pepsin inhibitor-3-like repeated domain-containing protein n=1 Tax=Plectus sambesii TaxID=2011161 RepID=A0A914W717_9BILA